MVAPAGRALKLEDINFPDLALDLMCIGETSGRITDMNESFLRTLGWSREEMSGRHFASLVHPDDLAATTAVIDKLAAGEPVLGFVNRCQTRDGSHVWLDWSAMALPNGQIFAVARNVTEAKRAEESLRFHKRLLDTVGQAVIAVDADRRVTYWNQAATDLYGWRAEEVLGQPLRRFHIVEMDTEQAATIVRRTLDGRPWQGEAVGRHRDGTTFPIYVTNTPVRDETGRVRGIIGVSHDLTPIKRALKERTEAIERLVLLNDATNDTIWDWDAAADIFTWNEQYAVTFGTPPDRWPVRLADWGARIHPEDRPRVWESFQTAMRGNARTWREEYRYEHETGRFCYVLDRGIILRDTAGRPIRIVGSMQDLTPQKRMEEQLRAAVARAEAAKRLAGLFSWEADFRTRTHHQTEATREVLGLQQRGAPPEGQDVFDLVHPDDRAVVDAWRDALDQRPDTLDTELRIRRRDGSYFLAHVLARPRLDASGATIGYVAVGRDVTRERQIEAELEMRRRHEAERERLRALGTLVAGVAHEINNPLTFIRGGAELTMMELEDALGMEALPPELRELLESICVNQQALLRGIDAIETITHGLKQIARPPGGKRDPHDLKDTLDGVLVVAASRIPSNIVIRREYGHAVATYSASEISQVLLNLLLNAGEAIGPRGGRITVALRETDDHVEVSIDDDGPGIPPDVATRLFVPFVTTKPNGTGLGLSLSRSIVESHGGSLTFETRLGLGTTFTMTLPKTPPAPPGS